MSRVFGLALVGCVALSLPVLGGVSVSGPFIDETTGGDWRGTYGECFYLIPDPPVSGTVETVGPDWCGEDLIQYRYTNCYGGEIFSTNPNSSLVDWRIRRNNADDPMARAFAATIDTVEGAAQWNPCLNQFRNASFSNTQFAYDPLTIDLNVNVKGGIQLAYYFTSASSKCREHDFRLLLDGAEISSGTVGDFAAGKYVVFELSGLKKSANGSTLTLEVRDAPGDAACEASDVQSHNLHVSGVFLSSPDHKPGSCSSNSGNGAGF